MRLTVVGVGIREGSQLTVEGIEAVKSAHKTLYLSVAATELERLLDDLGAVNRENLHGLYQDKRKDVDNYKAIFKRLLEVCYADKNVCLLLPGHPRVGVTIVQWLESLKEALGLELVVLEGLSSFCAMINDLKVDPLEKGSALLDCNRLLRYDYAVEPSINYFLYHICSVAVVETHLSDASKANRIDLLQAKLLKHFPSTHPVVLISSNTERSGTNESYAGTVGKLTDLLPHVHFGTTLYIPGTAPAASCLVFDEALAHSSMGA